jgi:hypothetical protein
MLLREFEQRVGHAQDSFGVAAQHWQYGSAAFDVRLRGHMRDLPRARGRFIRQLRRLVDVTKQPIRERQMHRCDRSDIHAEAGFGVAIAFGIVNPQRVFEACARREEIGEIKVRGALNAGGDCRLCCSSCALGLAQKCGGSL